MTAQPKRARSSRAAFERKCAKTPGKNWRVLAHDKRGTETVALANRGVFDELVVDHWLHIEQMDVRCWWASIGDVRIGVKIETDGRVFVGISRGEYGEAYGFTEFDNADGHVCVKHEPKRGKAIRGRRG